MSRYTLAVPISVLAESERRSVSRSTDAGDDAALFRRFLAGEDEAFHALFKRHNERLLVYCRKIVDDAGSAEDVTQEMWERVIALRARPQEVRNPVGFLLMVARNLCLDHLKKNRRLVPLSDLDESHHLQQKHPDLTELEEIAVASLDALSFEHREVLVLNLYSGYRFDEIAAMIGKTPDAVWAMASRARAQLRKIVARELKEMNRTRSGANNQRGNRPMEGNRS